MGCGTSTAQSATAQPASKAVAGPGAQAKVDPPTPVHKATPVEIAAAVLSKDNIDVIKDTLTGDDTLPVTWKTATTLGDEVYGNSCDDVEEAADIAREQATTLLTEALEHAAEVTAELVDVLQQVPMVGAVFSLMSVIIKRGKTAQANKHNCDLLVGHVRSARAVLTAVVQKDAQGTTHLAAAKEDISKLRKLLARANKLVDACHGKGWLLLMLTAPSDKRRFEELSQLMAQCLSGFQLLAVLKLSTGSFVNEMQDAAAEICKMTDQADPVAGLKVLARDATPARREQVAKLLGPGGTAHLAIMDTLADAAAVLDGIAASQAAMAKQMNTMSGQVADVHSDTQQLIENQRIQGGQLERLLGLQQAKDTSTSTGLPPYLRLFWEGSSGIGKLRKKVKSSVFVRAVVEWFKAHGSISELDSFDEVILADGPMTGITAGADSDVFLQVVVKHFLDRAGSGEVSRAALLTLQVTGMEYAREVAADTPAEVDDLLRTICLGFECSTFLSQPRLQDHCQDALNRITAALQVTEVIASYGIEGLVETYWPGSRLWMYERVNTWLDDTVSGTAPSQASPVSSQASPRIFLLLADAGMGKSVFSAVMDTHLVVRANTAPSLVMVRHFFKVGQLRAQGKTMILCLAQQLAEALPGFADLLLPLLDEHADPRSLSLTDTFKQFLKRPLDELESVAAKQEGLQRYDVLLLLDALDEADDAGKGWEAVTFLIAHEFVKLPAWVKVMLTSRPQVEVQFKGWDPKWIKPDEARNMEDMTELLAGKLKQAACVSIEDLHEAVQLMKERSKGQFVYVKYAFEELLSQPTWTVAQLQAKLPTGLSSMFTHVLSVLSGAFKADQRLDLLALLQQRVLPVLVVARDLLTIKELVWASGEGEREVELLVRLLGNLFPCSENAANSGGTLGPQHGIIRPYHKSVIDWLLSADAGDFRVDKKTGHHAIAQACHLSLQAASLQPPDQIVQPVSPEKGGQYALRHAVAHACQANDHQLLVAILHSLSMWEAIYFAGFGPSVLGDLSLLAKHAPAESAVVLADMTRWLRASNAYLVKHPRAVWQLAFDSPKNSCLSKLSATLPLSTVQLLNKEDDWPSCLASLEAGSSVFSVAICPDGTTFVSGCQDGNIKVWDLASGHCKSTLEGHTDYVACVAVSSDGTTIVSGSWDKTVRVWDLASGQCTTTLEGHTWHVFSVAVSPDGTTIMSGSRDMTVRVWDRASSQCKSTLEGHTGVVSSVAVSPDGTTIVSGSMDKTVRVWDLASGQCKSTLEGHTCWVTSVAISPDGTTIVSGSWDKTVRVWDLSSGLCKSILTGHGPVNSVAISSDGNSMVSGSGITVRVTDLASGQLRKTLEGHTDQVQSVAVSPDGTTIVSGSQDATLRVWDLAADQWMSTLQEGHKAWVSSVAVSPDGTSLVSGSHDNTVRVWDLASGRCKSLLEGHTERVSSVAVSPDGTTVVSGSYDKTVRVWDLASGQCKSTLTGHSSYVRSVAVTTDSTTIVSGSDDGTVRVWDLASGRCKSTLEGHTHIVNSVAVSPDGTTIVSGSRDKTVRVWDLVSGKCKSTLEGHEGYVSSVAISPDGNTIVSVGSWDETDETVRTWDLLLGTPLSVLTGAAAAAQKNTVCCWRNGSGSADGRVRTVIDESRGVVNVVTKRGALPDTVVSVYLLPPFVASWDLGVQLSADAKRLWVFDAVSASGRVLIYDISGCTVDQQGQL